MRSPARPSAFTLREHIRRTVALAVPVMIARAGLVIMVTVNYVMIGQVSSVYLAHYSISLQPHVTLLVVGIGLMAATTILSAQSEGRGRPQAVGGIWRTSLVIGFLLGLLEAVILFFGPQILLALDQPPDLAGPGGLALRNFAYGMPAIFMFLATTNFLEGIGRPHVGMVITIAANLVNAGFNWLLIEGNWGFPELGAAGATLATTITRWAMLAAALIYVLVLMRDRQRYDIRLFGGFELATAKRQVRLGLPLALSIAVQTAAMAYVATMAGWQGETTVAAYGIASNVIGFVFMLSIGLSTAAAVRAANAIGRGDRVGRVTASWVGLGMVLLLQLCVGTGIFLARDLLARAYTPDAAVLALLVPGLVLVSFCVVMDGAHNVMQGALRAGGDVYIPLSIYVLAYWCISVPLSYYLGYVLDWRVEGFLGGNLVGYSLAFVLLTLRFRAMSKHEPKPI
jgi:MATE family multidrug resistance protein